METKPLAVVISDIHFNVNNLKLAEKAYNSAAKKAESLGIPLIVAGDLNDTKAIIRAEVANKLIELVKATRTIVFILVGNHDLINEKGKEHSLNFLAPYANIIDYDSQHAAGDPIPGLFFIPYKSSKEEFLKAVSVPAKGSIIVCHQGFMGAAMGDYVQDKTSIDPELVKDFIVISGHYHRHQTLGTVTYIGSPYTMSFGEANDGPKGFLILNQDGSYEHVPLNLRRHIKYVLSLDEINAYDFSDVGPEDLVWVSLKGPESELKAINKQELGKKLFGHSNFKLELIPTMISQHLKSSSQHLTDEELFDSLINRLGESTEAKERFKALWRTLL